MKKFVPAVLATTLIVLALFQAFDVSAKKHKNDARDATVPLHEISWEKNRKLTWDDFRGAIPHNAEEQTAAATYCGIGFETNVIKTDEDDLKIRVYNTFYTNHSWARPEEMNDDVLAHEQGHFDLCEIYTRELRKRMSAAKVTVQTLKPTLRKIYENLQREYQSRQSAYEEETAHGVNFAQQKKWQEQLAHELAATEYWSN